MNVIIITQIAATLSLCSVLGLYAVFILRRLKLRRLFSQGYVNVIQTKAIRQFYPLIPRPDSARYKRTVKFLTSIGWRNSVESIYLCKWCMAAVVFFVLVTMQTTNSVIEVKEIVQDVNYNHNMIETLNAGTMENIALEIQLFDLVEGSLVKSSEIYDKNKKQIYIEYIENQIIKQGLEIGTDLGTTAERLYYKVLDTRVIKNGFSPYIYIFLTSWLAYFIPDILGQVKKKLNEDKKNWEILNCMIVFSIFGKMPPFSVMTVLEHMILVTEVYKPLLEKLMEGLKKGGKQEEVFNAVLEAVDREELYELIEMMKIARKTGFVNSVDNLDDAIANTIKWIEIENITRRRTKMLYAMSVTAVVIGLGCIYFAYGLTVISNPANMLMK